MRRWRLLFATTLILPLASCAGRGWFSPPAPFSDRAPCVLPPGAGKEQIIQHVNRNIQGTPESSGLVSWQSMSVRLTIRGFPPFPAEVIVEAPRNFRLRGSMPVTGGELVDMGSNSEEFWFWAKVSPHPNVITASHDDLTLARQRLDIPFHPDWLMEVLGVIPIDPESVTLQKPDPQSPIVNLVSDHVTPGGSPIQKVIRVDACHGIIREHALYDSRGILIASARLADHRIDKATGLITPRVIRLEWPQMQQQITLCFADMQINPPPRPASIWQVPEKPGYPRLELTQLLDEAHGNGLSPFGMGNSPPATMLQPMQHQSWNEGPSAQQLPAYGTVNGRSPGAAPLPAYSPGASRSSLVPPRRGRGLFGWPWR